MKCTNKYIVGFWHYGVILTYMSMIAAIVGMVFSALGNPGVAIICLYISGICDAFDGGVAKTRKDRSETDKRFGAHIDSLSDLIAFGVAPVMVGVGLGYTQWYFIVIYCVYVLSALVRLAYFDVTEEELLENGVKRTGFEGLPVTNITYILPFMYVIATMFLGPVVNLPILTAIIMGATYVVTSALFVFRFHCPKWGAKKIVIGISVAVVCMAALYTVRVLVFDVHML